MGKIINITNKTKNKVKQIAKDALVLGGIFIVTRIGMHAEAMIVAKTQGLLDFEQIPYCANAECEPGYRNEHPFVVSISSSFNDYYEREITEAIEYVDKVAEGLKFIIISDNADQADIVITPDSSMGFSNLGQANMQTREVRINEKGLHLYGIKATVTHELAHALGLSHSKDSRSLMYPAITRTKFSEQDIKDLNTIWPASEENSK